MGGWVYLGSGEEAAEAFDFYGLDVEHPLLAIEFFPQAVVLHHHAFVFAHLGGWMGGWVGGWVGWVGWVGGALPSSLRTSFFFFPQAVVGFHSTTRPSYFPTWRRREWVGGWVRRRRFE